LIAEPVKMKYPYLTFTMDKTTEDLPNLLAKGEAIDFHVTYQGRLPTYKDMGDYVDLLPLSKQYNFNLDRSLFNAENVNVLQNTKDINTALRDAEEQIKQYIAAEKSKK
jgi:hypothetical protein